MTSSAGDVGTPTEEVIAILNEGTLLHKVRSLDNFYARRFKVDLHNMRLIYSPSRKTLFFQEMPYGKSVKIRMRRPDEKKLACQTQNLAILRLEIPPVLRNMTIFEMTTNSVL
jgi:hypothetical protein